MSDTESESEFEASKSQKKKEEKIEKKSVEKGKGKGKQKVARKKKESQPQPIEKKEKESKGKKEDIGETWVQVSDYMLKQNRPYNLLNVFDNLHGKIKKPILEAALNDLVEDKTLTCKEFGKNKVYFANQDKLKVSKENVEDLGHQYTSLRAEEMELSEIYKKLLDEYKKLTAKKTLSEIKNAISLLQNKNQNLREKKQSLMSEGCIKIDEKLVFKIENDEKFLKKQLNKRRKLTKECLSIWSQMTQKKIGQVADMMGVQL